jgi:hypothetical protein
MSLVFKPSIKNRQHDNVASTGEEQIQMAAQFSGATEVERDVGTADAFFGDTAEQPFTAVLTGQQQL